MADGIVSLAIERISDLLIHEAVFLSGVREEVELLQAELKRMKCFLEDASHWQEQDKRFLNRVAEIRDLAYDAEDVIDSFILKVAHQEGSQGFIKRFTSIFTKPFHLHKIGEQVKGIQTKLEGISKSLPAYEIPSTEGEGSSSISWIQPQQRLIRRTYSHDVEEDVVSLDGVTKNVLAQLMKEEEDRRHVVVSIVGMGGIGKTTLAKKVYNHIAIKQHFDCLAWAFISQECQMREVLHDFLIKVFSPSNEERKKIDKMREDELVKTLFNALGEKRFLIVLDDIWRSEDWNSLKPAFPQGRRGSKILFTTRNKDVASLADIHNTPIELPLLSDDDSWKLFCKKAFPRNKLESGARSREFEKLGRKMVKKSGGLPLAIVALGGLLATKSSLAQWEMVQRNIHGYLNKVQQQDHQYGAVKGILALSYNDLPYHLKPCFLYLGHYPEDWEIPKRELIQLWIAEGFISLSMESGEMLMEDVAEQFLEELMDRCLVQVGKRDYTGVGAKTCRLHDLLRDLCIEKAQEEKFLEIIQPPSVENFDDSLDVTLSKSMQRKIAIHPNKRYASLKGKHPNLRSLLLFQSKSLIEIYIPKCKNFKLLRVLKLVARNGYEWQVSSEIGNMHHLRYLGLICGGEIILPPSIGKLKSLHTLHAQCFHGSIRILNVLFKLEHLRHIFLFDRVKDFTLGSKICLPVGDVKCFRNIETLKYIRIENLFESNINTVLSLINVRSLGVSFERSKDVEPILKAVVQSNRLHSLYMKLLERSESYPDLEPLSQCHHLSKLFLQGRIQRRHDHHHALKFVPASIVELTLKDSRLSLQDSMVVLEKLPHLRILRLWWNSYRGSKLKCSANGFPQLHSLEMRWLTGLLEWEIEEGAMPILQSLHLCAVDKLKKLSEGLRHLTALQEMKLELMKKSLVERIQLIDGREGDDFCIVSHIPSIQIIGTQED
ncbi:hypothetical protein PTKIN_Ptkin16aG0526400 [Pterospermum kingtungense]